MFVCNDFIFVHILLAGSGIWKKNRQTVNKNIIRERQHMLAYVKPYETNRESSWNHLTANGGHANVGWLSNNVGRFKQLGKILKKSLNGHRTVVGGHATVDRLSCTIRVVVTLLPEYCTGICDATKFPNPLNITVALMRIRIMYKQSTIRTLTQPSPDCQALSVLVMLTILCREERESISVTLYKGTAMLCRRLFH